MQRPPLPRFLAELVADRQAASTLVAGALALFAAGVDPRVWGPTLTTVQSAIRARPELEALVYVGAVGAAVLLLAGGAIGDLRRARPLILGGLVVLAVTGVAGLIVTSGPVFAATRLLASGAAALIVPVSLASVAMAYRGVARATAIGFAYAAFGGGQALMPILLTSIPGAHWPGFGVGALAAVIALRVAWRRTPDLPRPGRAERPYVLGTALWASSVVAISAGLLWLGGGWDNPVRLAIIGLGVVLLLAFFAWEARRRAAHPAALTVDRRPVTIVLFVGVVIAIAQAVPMTLLPFYFTAVAGYGPVFGIVALAPLFLALVAAGPVAGFLLARTSPRTLVGAGVLAVGLGDLGVAVIAGPTTGYVLYILPLVLVGAGFVIATTVRTAIIFASVPRGLPATAAALNEASIAVGSRVGIVLVTAIVTQTALAAFEPSIASLPADAAAAARQQFSDLLYAAGTPSFASLAEAIHPADVAAYADAYVTGVRTAMFLGGIAALLGGVVAWVGLGRRDPLVAKGVDPMGSVYEHRDEREAVSV
jgi:DHA2 family multidrug resistance protein-like MFS transporter